MKKIDCKGVGDNNGFFEMTNIAAWIKITDKTPAEGQAVIYYFDMCGTYRGKYTEIEYPAECGLDENGHTFKGHQFYGDKGFLTDDVTHWMPDDGQELKLLPRPSHLT